MAWAVPADACRLLSYTFQPDCFRSAGDTTCVFDDGHPDFGPQIAVWLERADGSFVDTLMVTNAVAVHGLGNRPGQWNMRSGPRFPYGRRPMALPIWAHARGELYPLVVMNDGLDDQMTGHENDSSPEPYFCRPMQAFEVVDAITCPSGLFRSAKGLLDTSSPASYYPPRADLFNFTGAPCARLPQFYGSCDYGDSASYAFMNDVDALAAATPPYGAPATGTWPVPDGLADGGYVLAVEVGKEFDQNAADTYPSYLSPAEMPAFDAFGQDGNVGQPSVLYRVPFTLAGAADVTAAASDVAGYGDWTGETGDVSPPDATISDDPGSGAGRLLLVDTGSGPARVQLAVSACPTADCTGAPAPLPVSFTAAAASSGTAATLHVHQSGEAGQPVLSYDSRYAPLPGASTADATSFPDWTPTPNVPVGAPDTDVDLQIEGLAPEQTYVVGIQAIGSCGSSPLTFQTFHTPAQKFTQLSGCFVATAAFGSDLTPEVRALRAARDTATAHSAIARAVVDLYYRSSPPLANLIAHSDTARALVRDALRALLPVR